MRLKTARLNWHLFAATWLLVCSGCAVPSLSDVSPTPATDPTPPTQESCDGEDNDQDGAVDEGFTDSDGDGRADCIDPPPCDGLEERDEPQLAGTDESCLGDPFELTLEEFHEAPAGGGLNFGPLEDGNGDGVLDRLDPHGFVFIERPFGRGEAWWPSSSSPPAGSLRVVASDRDVSYPLVLSQEAAFAIVREQGELVVYGTTPEQLVVGGGEHHWEFSFGTWRPDGSAKWAPSEHVGQSSSPPAYGSGPAYGAGALRLRAGAASVPDIHIGAPWGFRTGGGVGPCPGWPPVGFGTYGAPEFVGGVGSGVEWFFSRQHGDPDGDGGVTWSRGPAGWFEDCDQNAEWTDPDGVSSWFQFPTQQLDDAASDGWGTLHMLAPAQLDLDPQLEGFWWSDVDGLAATPITTAQYYLGVDDDGTLLWSESIRDPGVVSDPDCDDPWPQSIVADFDNDGLSEFAVHLTCPDQDSVSTRLIDDDGRVLWTATVSPGGVSGYGPAAFDFDGDGVLDIARHVGNALQVLDGLTGGVLGEALAAVPSEQALADIGRTSSNRQVGSGIRLLVLDVDGDDSAEVVVPQMEHLDGRIGIGVFGHRDRAFPPTGRVHSQDGLPAVCVSAGWEIVPCDDWLDLGIPSDGNVALGPALDLPRARIEIEVVDRCGQCAEDGIRAAALSLSVRNRGLVDWTDPVRILASLQSNGEAVGEAVFDGGIPAGMASATLRMELGPDAIDAPLRLDLDLAPDDRRLCVPPEAVLFTGPSCEW